MNDRLSTNRLPPGVPKYRTKVRTKLTPSYDATDEMTREQIEAIIAHCWRFSEDKETEFDDLLDKMIAMMKTWFGVPAKQRGPIRLR